jgi:hypothetical protein
MTSIPDEAPTDLIAAEIRSLRKGRGIMARDLRQRVGRYLRELAGDPQGDVSDLRRSLASELISCAAKLPDDLNQAIMASLGLLDEHRQLENFGDRVTWLAEKVARNERTVLRRIDEAERLLAEEISTELRSRRGRVLSAANGWYLDEFRTVFRLDTPTPEAHERRRIVAIKGGLSEVMAWTDVPRDQDQPRMELQAEVLVGGRLVRRPDRADPAGHRHAFYIELPAPLAAGDTHEYELILRVPPGEPIRSHYIFTPEAQCNAFDLTVRFDLARLPAWIRVVSGETVRMFDPAHPGDPVELNGAGEAHVQFANPVMYLGYGLQWQF